MEREALEESKFTEKETWRRKNIPENKHSCIHFTEGIRNWAIQTVARQIPVESDM